MSSDELTFDQYDEAIIRALRKHPQGMRYTELNNRSVVTGQGHHINVKTYDRHLALLVKEGVVDRFVRGRARVVYKLHPTLSEEREREFRQWAIENWLVKELVSLFERRHEIDKVQGQTEFNRILRNGALRPMINSFVDAIRCASDDSKRVARALNLNIATEHFREGAIAVNKVIEQNQETRDFFYPLLMKF